MSNLIYPMNKVVHWNKDEKIIGVIGVAPTATADFYSKLIRLTPAQKEWEHAHVLIDSNPKIPSRGRYFELGETDPTPFIRNSIERLCHMGATIIAIPCNTVHILYERYTYELPVTIIHMIKATIDSTVHCLGKIPQKAAVFASRLTQQYQLYDQHIKNSGGDIISTKEHQSEISSLIEGVKQGQNLVLLEKQMRQILAHYSDADVFILGCTELSLLVSGEINNIPIVDSNTALAEACLTLSNNQVFNY